jgi:hypothetical protein
MSSASRRKPELGTFYLFRKYVRGTSRKKRLHHTSLHTYEEWIGTHKQKGRYKVVRVHAMKANGGKSGTVPLILDLGVRRR